MLVVPTILSSGKVYRFQLSRHHYTPRLIRPPISLVVPEINISFRRSLVNFFSSLRPILASLLSFDSSTDSKRERGPIVESNFSLQLGKIDLFNAKVCRPLSRGVGVTTTESQMIYKRAKVEQVPLKLVQKLLEIVPYLDAFQKWIPSSSDTRLRTFETFWKRLNRSIFKLWAGTLSRLRERTKWGGVVSAFAQHLHFLSPM